MTWRLHTGGRFRSWLGARFGGDAVLGDRVWRRILHGLGAGVLFYYPLPNGFFVVLPKVDVLLLALAAVMVLETLRHAVGLELPTIRPYEERRVASFAWYATALVAAVLLFPTAVAAAVVLGTALIDPLAGEVRNLRPGRALEWAAPIAAYAPLAFVGLAAIGGWPTAPSGALAVLAALLAVAAERPQFLWVDDDLAMTFVPAVVLTVIGYAAGLTAR